MRSEHGSERVDPRFERLKRLKETTACHATPPRHRTPKHGAKKPPKPRDKPSK